ncbi:MAG: methyltransferase domain-containing protein [Acidobacteriota bacterium]
MDGIDEPRVNEVEAREVTTRIVQLPSKHLPANVWRSGAEMQGARLFRRRAGLDYEAMVESLVETAEPRAGMRALDVETGTGFIARQLSIRVGATGHVVGVDQSEEMVEQARLGAHSAGLTMRADWQWASVDRLPFSDDEFDIVTCGAVFHRLPTNEFLGEAHRVLKPGGRLVIADELKSPAGVLALWLAALRSYDRFIRREPVNPNERFFLAEEIVDMLTVAGFSQMVVKGLQARNRRGRAFSLIKAVK